MAVYTVYIYTANIFHLNYDWSVVIPMTFSPKQQKDIESTMFSHSIDNFLMQIFAVLFLR